MSGLKFRPIREGDVIRVISIPEHPRMHKLPISKFTDEPISPSKSVGCGEKKCFICDMLSAAGIVEAQKKTVVTP